MVERNQRKSIEIGDGMQALTDLYGGEAVMDIDFSVFDRLCTVSPIIRGTPTTTETSIDALLSGNDVFSWWKEDRESFIKAAAQDRDLRDSLRALTELGGLLIHPEDKEPN